MTTTAKSPATVYLDATVFSYLHDRRQLLRFQAATTRRWWRTERPKCRTLTSRETMDELASGSYAHQKRALAAARRTELLPYLDRIAEIARVYIREFVMPRKLTGDATHLAYASVYEVDFLLTWNCDHLANANKSKHIQRVNDRLGLHTPGIVTPMELFEEAGV
jgi:predicted nucleic acid-binding protein